MTLDVSSVLSALDHCKTIIVLGHEDPDADCLCSQRVLESWLTRKGKNVSLCNAGPWKRMEIASWKPLFMPEIPGHGPDTLTVIVDCSSFERTGFGEESRPDTKFAIIDHHSTGENFGTIRCVEPGFPSTTLMIQQLVEQAGDTLTREEAELLFVGFCTDSGFFRHLEEGSGWVLGQVSRLLDAGVSPSSIYRKLVGGHEPDSRILLGHILSSITMHVEEQVVIVREELQVQKKLEFDRDSDMLYQLLLSIKGVRVAAAVREQKDGTCTVGLRSVGNVDVGAIAEHFGGGGHVHAAGCLVSGSLDSVIERLEETIRSVLN